MCEPMKRSVDLTQWLRFTGSGKYAIEAICTVEIENPEKGASPIFWKVKMRSQFAVQVGKD